MLLMWHVLFCFSRACRCLRRRSTSPAPAVAKPRPMITPTCIASSLPGADPNADPPATQHNWPLGNVGVEWVWTEPTPAMRFCFQLRGNTNLEQLDA